MGVEVLNPSQPARAGGWKVDVNRGERNWRVSSEWFNRPDDERYLRLDDLWANVKYQSERSRMRVVQTVDNLVEALRDNAERLFRRTCIHWSKVRYRLGVALRAKIALDR